MPEFAGILAELACDFVAMVSRLCVYPLGGEQDQEPLADGNGCIRGIRAVAWGWMEFRGLGIVARGRGSGMRAVGKPSTTQVYRMDTDDGICSFDLVVFQGKRLLGDRSQASVAGKSRSLSAQPCGIRGNVRLRQVDDSNGDDAWFDKLGFCGRMVVATSKRDAL